MPASPTPTRSVSEGDLARDLTTPALMLRVYFPGFETASRRVVPHV